MSELKLAKKAAEALLEKYNTVEKAIALTGAERAKYLAALDTVYGSQEARAKSMGFGDKTWYHGTSVPIDEFKNEAKGLSTNAQSAKKGFFFAEDPSTASDYADLAQERGVIREGDTVTTRGMSDTPEPDRLGHHHYGDAEMVLRDLQSRTEQELKRKQTLKDWQTAKAENKDWLVNGAKRSGQTIEEFIADKTARIQTPIKPASAKEIEAAKQAYHQALIDFAKTNEPDYTEKILGIDLEKAKGEKREAILKAIKTGRDFNTSQGQNVVPVRLKGDKSNIHVKDYQGQGYRDTTYANEMDQAQAEGKTGVLFKNTYDAADPHNKVEQDIAAVFNPEQVRSTNAAFDPRFANSAKIAAGAAAVPTVDVSPLPYIKQGVDWYHENVSDPLKKTFVNQMDLTPDKSMKDDFLLNMASEAVNPINYIPGAGGMLMQGIEAGAEMIPKYAEGGAVDFDSMVADDMNHSSHDKSANGLLNFDDLIDDEDKYGTSGQQAITALEGAGQGLLGPLAPLIETKVLGVKPEDIRMREETNPITHGVSEAGALVGGMFIPGTQGALMGKAGSLAAKAVPVVSESMAAIKTAEMGVQAAKAAGVGLKEAEAALKATKAATPLIHKVGSSAVKEAAEMAVLQSGDEVSKMILQDPDASAENAISNIGLAAALGAGGGIFMTGAVNPLWEATAGPKVEALLNATKSHFDGGTALMPSELQAAKGNLGIDIAPEIEAYLSGNATAISHGNILKEVQNSKFMNSLDQFNKDMTDSVAGALKISPEEVAVRSPREAGHELRDTVVKEYEKRYGPIAEAFERRNNEAAAISISDDARLDQYGKMLETGMNKVGTDSPHYKLYNDYGNRLLAKETIGGIDMLKTELGGEIDKAVRAADTNALMVLRDIRSSLSDFQEQQILKQAGSLEKEGAKGAGKLGKELLEERSNTNKMYKDFANLSNELTDNLSIGRFTGAKGLTDKLINKLSPEQLLDKFSIKGNTDFIPFLQKNFPETYQKIVENELKNFIKPAVLSAKGEAPINIKKLSELVNKGMANDADYVKAILPQEAIDKITSAGRLMDAIPTQKSSGTAGHMARIFTDVPRSAMAAIAAITGHNPIVGGILGEIGQRLGRDVPDAIRLAHLKFLASEQPVKASGFKAMVDFFHATYKGENLLAKATGNVLKRGAQVLGSSQLPSAEDREKLDKTVTKLQERPNQLMNSQNGQVGHYLPDHQTALAATSTRALQYLQSIKPQPHVLGVLDKPVPPLPMEVARYNRALDIAQQPAVVLEHIKNGTLQISDVKDLNAMYPALYKQMSQGLSKEIMKNKSNEEPIPYKSRIGISLFLGQPLDATMNPSAIMASQPIAQNPQQAASQPSGKSMKSLGKTNDSYETPLQSAEKRRARRD